MFHLSCDSLGFELHYKKHLNIFSYSLFTVFLLSDISLFSPPVFSRVADESFCPAPISSPFLRLRDGLTEHRKEEAVIKGESWPAGSGTGSVRWTINVGASSSYTIEFNTKTFLV